MKRAVTTVVLFFSLCPCARAADPVFESQLFESGTLIYSDDFNGEYDKERWGAPKKDRQISDGKLVVTAQFKSKEEAMNVLKRDHHLGLEPVVHLNRIPEAFVCHIRFRFETNELTPGRPVLQIGHPKWARDCEIHCEWRPGLVNVGTTKRWKHREFALAEYFSRTG